MREKTRKLSQNCELLSKKIIGTESGEWKRWLAYKFRDIIGHRRDKAQTSGTVGNYVILSK